jgi:Ca2+-binding RTX toxin-like protein
MSELIIVNPGTPSTGPVLGLNIINELPVQVLRETPEGPIIATGSAGRDVIRVANPLETTSYQVDGGADRDDLAGGTADDTLSGGDGDDIVVGRAGNDQISGGAGKDTLLGGPGNDQIQGNDGIDLIDAGPGDDRVDGGDGNDTLLGGPGNDELFGGANEDVVRGGDGDDTLSGGGGSDTIRGGAGDDLLIPGAGKDIMKGGAGADTFRFTTGSTGQGQLDRIVDFSPEEDVIELSRSLLPNSGLERGTLSSESFAVVRDIRGADTEATLIYEQRSGILYYSPTEGRDVPLLQLRRNLADISASNFTIF